MEQFSLFRKPITWAILVLLSLGSGVFVYQNFEKANPLVNVDITMSRDSALAMASRMSQTLRLGPERFRQAASFTNDFRFQNYVELEGGGLDTFSVVMQRGDYHPYRWVVRQFQEYNPREVLFRFTPEGKPYGFKETLPEDFKGAALDSARARYIAEESARKDWHANLTNYHLVEHSIEVLPSERIDHTFVYENDKKSIGDGKYRLRLVVSGDRLTELTWFVKIPEAFDRKYEEMRSSNTTLSSIATLLMALLYGLGGIVIGLFFLMKRRYVLWRKAFIWGFAICFFSVFLVEANQIPLSWLYYETSTSASNYIARTLLYGFLSAIGMGALVSLSITAGEGMGRMAFPRHVQFWHVWSNRAGSSKLILGQTLGAYLFMVIVLAFDIAFYMFTTRHFGWWSPAGTLSDPDILATPFPWLSPFSVSLQAGFWEEAMFRAIPLAGVVLLTRNWKSHRFWVILVLILQTVVFGLGHANYPNQPSYARVVEMLIPFVIFGIIYLQFGLLPVIITHYTVDVFWISLPLWVASSPGIWIDRVIIVLLFFTPLFIILFFRLRNKKWTELPDTYRNWAWRPPESEEEETSRRAMSAIAVEVDSERRPVFKWILPVAVFGILLWAFFSRFDHDDESMTIKRKAALGIAQKEMAQRISQDTVKWTVASTVQEGGIDHRFVWQEGGSEIYKQLLGNFLEPSHFMVRYMKTEGSVEDRTEEFRMGVSGSGELLSYLHVFPEKWPGANLTRAEASELVDSLLHVEYQTGIFRLKEISVTPEKLDRRTDWKFTYADTVHYPLRTGEARYQIQLAGNKIAYFGRSIHVPEEWQRDHRDRESKLSVWRTISWLILVAVVIAGIVIGIVRWTKGYFSVRLFGIMTVFLTVVKLLSVANGWSQSLYAYPTGQDFGNYITVALIFQLLGPLFLALGMGVVAGMLPYTIVAQERIDVSSRKQFGLGLLLAGVIALLRYFRPELAPYIPWFGAANDYIPWLGVVFHNVDNFILLPVFAWLITLGLNRITHMGKKRNAAGVMISLLMGLSITGSSLQQFAYMVPAGIVVGLMIWSVWYFAFRYSPSIIPVVMAGILVPEAVRQAIMAAYPGAMTGEIITLAVGLTIAVFWSREVRKITA